MEFSNSVFVVSQATEARSATEKVAYASVRDEGLNSIAYSWDVAAPQQIRRRVRCKLRLHFGLGALGGSNFMELWREDVQFCPGAPGPLCFETSIKQHIHVVKSGINYRFGPSAVVARY
jgi:hypothetical protein